MIEPPDLWLGRMDRRYRDRASRIGRHGESDCLVFEGQALGVTTDEVRSGGWDPVAREGFAGTERNPVVGGNAARLHHLN